MAKIGTEDFFLKGESSQYSQADRESTPVIRFKYSIDVSKGGVFSTMLPEDIVSLFESSNIKVSTNNAGRKGYVSSTTLEGLKSELKKLCGECLSRELVSEGLVIKYGIKTQAAYCISHDGEIVPNAGRDWLKGERTADHDWKNGTETQHATSPLPFGMMVYVRPFRKQVFKYKSGAIKEEIIAYHQNSADADVRPNLHWISSICSISPTGLRIQEIPYTEDVAGVFVNMIKSICSVNEKVKDFISPEAILQIANNNQRLLG